MAYSPELAARVRTALSHVPNVVEKKMFGGLAFLVNDKMCVNVGDDRLMCRFDPALTEELSIRNGFLPMIMRNREYKGYCYVEPAGYASEEDFEFWIQLCLNFNSRAKSSKQK